jgi:peptide-methionine (R)-S-oxide reductase
MNRRTVLHSLLAFAALPLLPACSRADERKPATGKAAGSVARLDRPHAYWRDKVSGPAYAVLFQEATERAFSSPLDKEKRDGTYICAACHLPLFDSAAKFDSGTGWPSFTRAIAGHTGSKRDFVLFLPRIEYHCARCGGHQGHVFDDGPPPLGKRWCNNGVALAFVPRAQPLPALRG